MCVLPCAAAPGWLTGCGRKALACVAEALSIVTARCDLAWLREDVTENTCGLCVLGGALAEAGSGRAGMAMSENQCIRST